MADKKKIDQTKWVIGETDKLEKYCRKSVSSEPTDRAGRYTGQEAWRAWTIRLCKSRCISLSRFVHAVSQVAVHNATKQERAVKIINKARFSRSSDRQYHFEQLRFACTWQTCV